MDTRTRILDTAEHLFATEGASAVTLRSIAASAGVNIAAVNYHFGSKENLFEEMFIRRVAPLNERRLQMLDECLNESAPKPAPLETIVRAFIAPAIELARTARHGEQAIIVQFLLGRILSMPEVNAKLTQYYDLLRRSFVAALSAALPHLTHEEVVWRYYWMGGCVMVSLAISPLDVSEGNSAKRLSEANADQITSFIVSAMQGLAS